MTDARFIDIGVFLASVQQGFFFARSVWSGCQVSIDWKMRLVRLDSIPSLPLRAWHLADGIIVFFSHDADDAVTERQAWLRLIY